VEREVKMTNLAASPYNLTRLAMPIIKVIQCGQLSWKDKEDATDALREVFFHWRSLEREHQDMMQDRAGGQQAKCCRQNPCIRPGLGPCDMPATSENKS
jgi:hypothetical protein